MQNSVNDYNLVAVQPEACSGAFFAYLLLALIALTVIWAAVMDPFLRFKPIFTFTTGELNVADMVRAMRTPDPVIAIAGSSLSRRLETGLFSKTKVMNLAMSGGSVITGLEALASRSVLPRLVLAEINILDRPIDESVQAGKASAGPKPLTVWSGASRPLRYLLTEPFFSHVSEKEHITWWSNRREVLRAKKYSEYDVKAAVAAGRLSWDSRNSWDIANTNFQRIEALRKQFESRGSTLYFLYLPYATGYDTHRYAQRNREIASGNNAFECPMCLDVRKLVPVKDLRWKDGAHLDEKSALIVAEALENYLLAGLSTGAPK